MVKRVGQMQSLSTRKSSQRDVSKGCDFMDPSFIPTSNTAKDLEHELCPVTG